MPSFLEEEKDPRLIRGIFKNSFNLASIDESKTSVISFLLVGYYDLPVEC